jgi:hypothetical protein
MSMSKPRCAGMHSREKLMKSRDELDRLAQLNRDVWQVWPIVPSAAAYCFPSIPPRRYRHCVQRQSLRLS